MLGLFFFVRKSRILYHCACAKVNGFTHRGQHHASHQQMHYKGAIGEPSQNAKDGQAGELAQHPWRGFKYDSDLIYVLKKNLSLTSHLAGHTDHKYAQSKGPEITLHRRIDCTPDTWCFSIIMLIDWMRREEPKDADGN